MTRGLGWVHPRCRHPAGSVIPPARCCARTTAWAGARRGWGWGQGQGRGQGKTLVGMLSPETLLCCVFLVSADLSNIICICMAMTGLNFYILVFTRGVSDL